MPVHYTTKQNDITLALHLGLSFAKHFLMYSPLSLRLSQFIDESFDEDQLNGDNQIDSAVYHLSIIIVTILPIT